MTALRFLLALAVAAALAGCGAAEATIPPPTAQSDPAQEPAPTQPPAPTQAPAQATPEPTSAPAPTQAPTIPPPTATVAPPTPTQPPAPTQAPATALPNTPAAQPGSGATGEILFLRGGALVALDVASGAERRIAEGVGSFAASPDGALIALVRGSGSDAEIWVVRRDGGDLSQITRNDRSEATISWAPDGQTLIYASSADDAPYVREWQPWARWCALSEVRFLDLASGAETPLAPGCDPAISPDGRRIAFAAPPRAPAPGYPTDAPLTTNSIRLINRQGQNGWNFATASVDLGPESGLLVYAPSWSPDGASVIYHRFMGMRVEVDINMTEIGGSFDGKGQPLGDGAGWLLPAQFAPGGGVVAIVENDYGNARGLTGYDAWSARLIRLEGAREIFLPDGPLTVIGQEVGELRAAQAIAWSPRASGLAVLLPPGWQPGREPAEGGVPTPGEIWRWEPGKAPATRLAVGVDYGSPLAWLP